jgi:hypothetical protein
MIYVAPFAEILIRFGCLVIAQPCRFSGFEADAHEINFFIRLADARSTASSADDNDSESAPRLRFPQ